MAEQTPNNNPIGKAVTGVEDTLKKTTDGLQANIDTAVKQGEQELKAGVNSIWLMWRKYVYIFWTVLTLAGIGISIMEFRMLTKAGQDADKYKKELADLKKQSKQIDYQIQTNIVVREQLVKIEQTNYIILTNMGVALESNQTVYASYGTNYRAAMEHYQRNATK